jgi:hypothetical protein
MAEDQGVTELNAHLRSSLGVRTSRTLCWEAKNMLQNSDPKSSPKEKEKNKTSILKCKMSRHYYLLVEIRLCSI